jgi:hypothetical protein
MTNGCSTSVSQVDALNDLYIATNGADWDWSSQDGIPWDFASSSDPCNDNWQGITCDSFCDIHSISLSNHNLNGTLPSSFILLPQLRSLNLSDNLLVGPIIATTLAASTDFQILVLSNNQLTGTLPTTIGLLTNLVSLFIDGNRFNGTLPSTLTDLSNLRECVISRNWFSGTLPPNIGDLQELFVLSMDLNQLSGSIPPSISSLSKLTSLSLSSNRFIGQLPSKLNSLSSLIQLNLQKNNFTGTLPPSLFTISSLTQLILNENNFIGNISSVLLTNLVNLESFQISGNYFSGSLPSIFFTGILTKLQILVLSDNAFVGTLPGNVMTGPESGLLQFDIADNYLYGTIPAIFSSKFNKLKLLSLSYNFFNGSFEGLNIDKWTDLEYLLLDNNQFVGSMPDAMYQLQLVEVSLSNNFLTGSLSTSIGQLGASILVWESSNNLLTGEIPTGITALPLLETLQLDNNHFSNSLPPDWSHLGNLQSLLLHVNNLYGSIPSSLSALSQLAQLHLSENKFTGMIPANLSSLQLLKEFILAQNELSGKLFNDMNFTSLVELKSLAVSQNYFSGPIFYPQDLGKSWSKMIDLEIDVNHFTGSISESITSMQQLQWFSANNNSLTGSIGSYFAGLKNLKILLLQNNELTGKVELLVNSAEQKVLNTIDLSNNKLSGSLPMESIFNLPQLLSFAAVKNCLSGSLSEVICSSNQTLQVLALDGLSTAENCRNRIFPDISASQAYFLQHHLTGSIPDCLFTEMKALMTLHLSGNGLTGSIPDVSTISSLQDLSLAYNQLTGTIPLALQEYSSWANFDLSHNKIHGILDKRISTVFSSPSTNDHTLTLDNNRLSGNVPSSLLNAISINILEGNIFSCDTTSSSASSTNNIDDEGLPNNDPNVESYECGSNEVNYAFYVWIIITGLVIVYSLILWFLPRLQHAKQSAVKKFDVYYEIFSLGIQQQQQPLSIPQNQQYIATVGVIYSELRHWCVSVTAVIVVVFLPTYLILSLVFSSYSHTYAWELSLAYFSGIIPSIIITIMLITFLTLLYIRFPRPFSLNIYSMKRSIEQQIGSMHFTFFDDRNRRLATFYSSLLLVTLFNFLLVVVVNMAYLYEISSSTTHSSSTRKQGLAMAMALFNLTWNKLIFIVFDSQFFRYYVNPTKNNSAAASIFNHGNNGFDDSTVNSILTTTILGTTLFNNVIAPCIAVACISSTCFYYAFQQADDVNTMYSVEMCSPTTTSLTDGGKVAISQSCLQQSATFYSTYPPPFYYSYQCSSTLLANFSAIFIYRFLFVGVVLPAWKISCKSMQELLVEKYGENHVLTRLINDYTIPIMLRPITPKLLLTDSLVEKLRSIERNSKSQLHHERSVGESLMPMSLTHFPVFSCKENVVSIVTDIAIVLTFGVVFPPLAVVGCLAILAFTYFVQLSIGRLCYLSKFQLFLARYVDFVNLECRGMHLLLIKSLLTIPFLIATFWSLFLFDILGDRVGVVDAVWIIPFMTCVPLIIYLVNYFIPKDEDRDENVKIALARRSESDSGKSPFHRQQDDDGFFEDNDLNSSDGIQLREGNSNRKGFLFGKNKKKATNRSSISSNLRQSLLQESFQYDNPVFRTNSNQSTDIN